MKRRGLRSSVHCYGLASQLSWKRTGWISLRGVFRHSLHSVKENMFLFFVPKCAWLCYTELLTLWKTTKPKTVSLLRDLSRTRQNYKMGPLWHLILLLINYQERGEKNGILPFPISKITELPRVLLISSSSHFKTLSHVTFNCLLRSSEGGTQPNFVLGCHVHTGCTSKYRQNWSRF